MEGTTGPGKALSVSKWKNEVQTTMTYQQFPAFWKGYLVLPLFIPHQGYLDARGG